MMNDHRSFHQKRAAWLLLAASAFALEAAAIWFQYGMQLDPCVMCIYERLAVVGVFAAGLIGAVLPRSDAASEIARQGKFNVFKSTACVRPFCYGAC